MMAHHHHVRPPSSIFPCCSRPVSLGLRSRSATVKAYQSEYSIDNPCSGSCIAPCSLIRRCETRDMVAENAHLTNRLGDMSYIATSCMSCCMRLLARV